MSLVYALRALWRYAFWTFVVRTGGPRHHSYSYARFEQWLAMDQLRRFVRGN